MEKIITQCSYCMTSMKVETKFIGRQVKCPKCSNSFTIQPIENRSTPPEKVISSTKTVSTSYKENLILGQKLIQLQRNLAQYFNQMVTERIQAETNANATLNDRRNSADRQLEQLRQELEGKLRKIATTVEQARYSLNQYWQKIANKTTVPIIGSRKSKDPVKEIDRYINRTEQILTKIKTLSNPPIKKRKILKRIFWTSFWFFLGIYILSIWGIGNEYVESVVHFTETLTRNFIPHSIRNVLYYFCLELDIPFENGALFFSFIFSLIIALLPVLLIGRFQFKSRQKLYMKLLRLYAEAENLQQLAIELGKEEYSIQVNTAQTEYKNTMHSIQENFDVKMEKLNQSNLQFTNQVAQLSPHWDSDYWNNFTLSDRLPPVTYLGELQRNFMDSWLFLPMLFPFPGTQSLLFKSDNSAKTTAVQAIQTLCLRLLATIPPGKLRFTFIDPLALGQNVAPFMHLADHDELLVTSRAWSEKMHIEKRLSDLTEHMSDVIQKYLRNTYATIEEYNQEAGEVAEPYRFLVVFNFPEKFTDDAARRLVSIIQNGPRCGVYSLIFYDTKQQMPHGFNPKDLEQSTIIFNWDGTSFIWGDSVFQHYVPQFDALSNENLFNQIIERVGKAAVIASKVEVPFEKILDKAGLSKTIWWQGQTIDGFQIPLGPIGAKKVQYLDFGKGTAQHAVIAGKTGSGKSTLLHILISSLMLKYPPDEVELYLIDFKKGVEFKIYATHQLPHARVIAIESEREFGLSVLEGLDIELKRRGDMCREIGVDSLKAFRQATSKRMTRILLVVDEFQEFFTIDDSVAAKAAQILDRLVRQGRAFGIHIILGSQTLAGTYTLARSTLDQMAIRIALQCSEADSRLILSEDNPAARLLTRPGEAIYNSANGLIEGNNPFQIAWLSDEDQNKYLDNVKRLAQEKGFFPPKSQIVFEGNAPADAEHNQALLELLKNPQWSKSLQRFSAWLGEPIAIKEETKAHFRRQSSNNLLIIGQHDELAMGMVITNVLSLVNQHKPELVQFYLLDFGSVDVPHAHLLNYVADMLPHHVKYGKKRHLSQFITAISQEVTQRLEHEEQGLDKKPSIYLIIYGLHRARDLEKDDSFGSTSSYSPPSFAFGASDNEMSAESLSPASSGNPGQLFPKILREGPDLGIHTIVWCDTRNNLQRRLDYHLLREFEMRVVLQMNEQDSRDLIDSPAASKLGQYRAYFYSEEEGRLEKFRPFALPRESWLKQIGEQFKARIR